MKLKCQPEDFRVEELRLAPPGGDGPGRYTLYRLTKRDLGTIEAVEIICRRWNLAGRRVSYAGLKDRHASTLQYLTIFDGPPRSLTDRRFELEPVGRLDHPYTSRDLRGNRFELILRGMTRDEREGALGAIGSIPDCGLPNYFDDQRFGSVGFSGEFIAHAWLLGDHERDLSLALAEPNPFDRAAIKAQKALLRTYWGRWPEAKARLARSSTRSIVTYLVDHPTDFRGAFARLRRELRTLYFSAFQSHLWNRILGRWLEDGLRPEQWVPIPLKAGTFPFPRRLEPEQVQELIRTPLPLPSARSALPTGRLGEVIRGPLEDFRLTWSDLRVKHLKDVFFSKGSRACLVFPENLQATPQDDDLHPGHHALRLAFDLPKGSYATILVKRLTEVKDPPR
jgi:tRNA pseudouridine13 synthase